MEPILTQSKNKGLVQRFVLKQEYPKIWNFYKLCEKSIWHADEIPLGEERLYFSKLNDTEKRIIKIILAFFAAADGIVNENLMSNFAAEVNIPEARCFYAFQAFTEAVHQETYSNLLNVYVPSTEENDKLVQAIETLPVIAKKGEWCLKWMGTKEDGIPFGQRLFAFACVEGIHFASSFATIYWFKQENKAPGLALANEWIARDETTHWQFAALLFGYLVHKPTQSVVEAIVREAVQLELEFVDYVMETPLLGLNATSMGEYVKSIADMILVEFGYAPIYGATNPYSFMKMIQLNSYSNFFEKTPTDYQKAKVQVDFSKLNTIEF